MIVERHSRHPLLVESADKPVTLFLGCGGGEGIGGVGAVDTYVALHQRIGYSDEAAHIRFEDVASLLRETPVQVGGSLWRGVTAVQHFVYNQCAVRFEKAGQITQRPECLAVGEGCGVYVCLFCFEVYAECVFPPLCR